MFCFLDGFLRGIRKGRGEDVFCLIFCFDFIMEKRFWWEFVKVDGIGREEVSFFFKGWISFCFVFLVSIVSGRVIGFVK